MTWWARMWRWLWWQTADRSIILWRCWRPYCWARGRHTPHHADVYYEMCTLCGLLLWSRQRDGTPRPEQLKGDRVATSWRRAGEWMRPPWTGHDRLRGRSVEGMRALRPYTYDDRKRRG